MPRNVPNSAPRGSRKFQQVVDAFLSAPGLPFARILSAERIERIFAKHGCLFGLHGIYSAPIMVWAFLSQVLRDGKEASCQAAVARVVSYCEHIPKDRHRIPFAAIRWSGTLSLSKATQLSASSLPDLDASAQFESAAVGPFASLIRSQSLA